ncbi:dimethyl sulfoxide reductase anchor subunit [Luteimonas sp. RD2P54]|uniref:Dimethyl sulfoxide reductase anchor subunit n=1 Tax=Luteimonas endophytica TaxID=3042023 RepID=A0ABT6J4M6_9GAMM|nr:DmsC/YnfH family molybdoenzyme membrane anchor subunit [Luteimonas endophytica]MDH5821759.1 dimethyl sulfoxide reductase anchor subunit [Luteimonas endophytica]
MHPALSVIFFTTLSGAGYGLLAWLGLSVLLLHARADVMPALSSLQLWALLLGLVLSTAGLLSSLAHLGRPLRAWRAISQWRTSWLSREGLLALATPLPALALGLMLLWVEPGPGRAIGLGLCGLLLTGLALATVACTAMIYASLPPIPAWRHPLVVPVYLLFALLTGLALLFWLMALLLPPAGTGAAMPATLAVLGALLLACKWLYWREIDRQAPPATRGDAVGLPGRSVSVFERPHTEASFVTREMAFAVARRHALRLRWLASALLLAAPAAAWAVATALPVPVAPLLGTVAAALLAAAFVERWLFFAEARHVVTLYY